MDKLTDNQRLVLAVALSLAVLLGWQFLFPPPKPAPKPAGTAVATEGAAAAGEAAPEAGPPAALTVPPAGGGASAPVAASPTPISPAAAAASRAVVETELFRAVFSSLDGGLESLQLKKYREALDGGSAPIEMVHVGGGEARPLRIDAVTRSGGAPRPVTFDREAIDLSAGEYRTEALAMSSEPEPGLTMVRRLTFKPNSYVIDVEVELRASADRAAEYGIAAYWSQLHRASTDQYSFTGPEAFVDGTLEKEDPKDLEGAAEFARALFWIGYGDKYFLGALAPEEADRDRVVGRIAQTQAGNVYASLVYPVTAIPAGDARAYRFVAYVGPKEIDRLKDAGHGLEYALDHGWFGFISRPMLQLLKVFHGWTGNWGLAIILLTVLVKALFYPLTKKSYTSMKEMQKLQPHMQRIKEQFKDNKEAMNREMMELYRRHKVNPFAGCMPIVLQIPVFFGLYKALLNSIEIRHAPFYFWIHDLSAKDPFYVTPLIMGATMFLQQKMTPSTMDPAQQRIMNLMPIFFTFLFLNFPSGLVIYWLVNNILSIAQQYAINKKAEAA